MALKARVFKAGEDLIAEVSLPEDGHQMMESLLLVVQEAAVQLRVTPYQLLCDLAALDQGKVKW